MPDRLTCRYDGEDAGFSHGPHGVLGLAENHAEVVVVLGAVDELGVRRVESVLRARDLSPDGRQDVSCFEPYSRSRGIFITFSSDFQK